MKKRKILLGLGAFAFLGLALASCDNNKMYTVTFYNGTEELSHTEVKNGYNVEVPKAPETSGKVFNGWYKNAELTEQFDFGSIITGNTSIYARWENLYTVTFKNGSTTLSTATVQDGLAVKKPANPTVEGKVFAGWYADAAFTKEFDFGPGIKKDTTVYAKFVNATYSVKFMDGTEELAEASVEVGGKVTRPEEDPTKDGYTFVGYYADAAFTTEFNFDAALTGNTVVYLKFEQAQVNPYSLVDFTTITTKKEIKDTELHQYGPFTISKGEHSKFVEQADGYLSLYRGNTFTFEVKNDGAIFAIDYYSNNTKRNVTLTSSNSAYTPTTKYCKDMPGYTDSETGVCNQHVIEINGQQITLEVSVKGWLIFDNLKAGTYTVTFNTDEDNQKDTVGKAEQKIERLRLFEVVTA